MKKKLSIVVLALVFALSVALVACQHIHTFSADWSYDENNHWHAAVCEHNDEKSDVAPHELKGVPGTNNQECTVCGYVKKGTVIPPVHQHSYVDGICSGCGEWSSVTDVLLAQIAKSDLWNYTLVLNNVSIPMSKYEDYESRTLTGEISLSVNAQGVLSGYGQLLNTQVSKYTVNGNTETVTDNLEADCVIEDNVLYLKVTDKSNGVPSVTYQKMSVEDIFSGADIDVDQIKEALAQINAQTALVKEYVDQISEVIKNIEIGDVQTELASMMEGLFVKDGNSYSFRWNVAKSLNEMLATTTISQYVDGILGEGEFDKLPQTVESLLKLTVGDLLDELAKQGITVDEVLVAVNKGIAQASNGEYKTLDELLKKEGVLPAGTTVKDLIMSHATQMMTVEDLIKMVQAGKDEVIDGAAIKTLVTQFCTAYKDVTIYDVVVQLVSSKDPESFIGSSEELEYMVDKFIDLLTDNVDITVTVNNKAVEMVSLKVVGKPAANDDAEPDATPDFDTTVIDGLVDTAKGVLLALDFDVELSKNYTSTVDTAAILAEIKKYTAVSMPEEQDELKELLENALNIPAGTDVTVKTEGDKIVVTYKGASYLGCILDNAFMINQVTDEKYVLNLSDISAVKTCKENVLLNIGSVYSVTYGEIAYCKATVSDGGVTSVTSYAPATEADVIDALNSIKNDNPDVYKNEMDKLSSLKEDAQWNRKYPQSDRDPVRFAYDFATSKFSEDEVGHDMTLVESKCVYSETCGQYDKLVYHCSECGQDFIVYEEKTQDSLGEGE